MDSISEIPSDMSAPMAQLCIPTTIATAHIDTQSEHRLSQSSYDDVTAAYTSDKKVAQSTSASPASETNIVATVSVKASSLERLPGELRNRIYRAYFELSTKERRETPDLRMTAPSFLPLLHTNHMTRFEAGSVFDSEHLCDDNLVTNQDARCDVWFNDQVWSRIKSVCSLEAIRDIHSHVSITCSTCTLVGRGLFMSVDDLSVDLALFISQKNAEIVRGIIRTKQAGEHDFFSEEGDFGIETRIGNDHLIQTKVDSPDSGVIQHTFRISGPLAELNWPKGDWSELKE